MAATLKDIAKLAMVSKTTVSYVLNGEGEQRGIARATIERVCRIADQEGYIPNHVARSFRGGRQKLLAFLLGNVADPFFYDVTLGVERTVGKLGYKVIYSSTFDDPNREAEYVKDMISRRVDGIILYPVDPYAPHLTQMAEHKVPTIILRARGDLDLPYHFMWFDEVNVGYLATRHLIEQGCRKILFCDAAMPSEEPPLVYFSQSRRAGYYKALEEAGFTADPSMVFNYHGSEKKRTEWFVQALEKHRPDGLLSTSDFSCLSLMNTLANLKINIPDDIKLVGCDNLKMTPFLRPSLSTVDFPRCDLGRVCCETLLKLIENEDVPANERLFQPQLIARASSAKKVSGNKHKLK